MTHIIMNSPGSYDNIVENLEDKLDHEKYLLTLNISIEISQKIQ